MCVGACLPVGAFLLLFQTYVCLSIFSFPQTIFYNLFNITKTSKTMFYYLVQPFVENDRLECEYVITASRTVFVSCCVASD